MRTDILRRATTFLPASLACSRLAMCRIVGTARPLRLREPGAWPQSRWSVSWKSRDASSTFTVFATLRYWKAAVFLVRVAHIAVTAVQTDVPDAVIQKIPWTFCLSQPASHTHDAGILHLALRAAPHTQLC